MTTITVAALIRVSRLTKTLNRVEYSDIHKGLIVTINHKVYFGPDEICQGYPEEFFENVNEASLEEIGFEFVYGMNAY